MSAGEQPARGSASPAVIFAAVANLFAFSPSPSYLSTHNSCCCNSRGSPGTRARWEGSGNKAGDALVYLVASPCSPAPNFMIKTH